MGELNAPEFPPFTILLKQVVVFLFFYSSYMIHPKFEWDIFLDLAEKVIFAIISKMIAYFDVKHMH